MKPIQRLQIIKEHKNLSFTDLDGILNFSNGAVSKSLKANASLKDETLIKLLEFFPDINCEWLLLGEGEMLKTDSYYVDSAQKVNEAPENYGQNTKLLLETIESLKKDKSFLHKQIDFLNDQLDGCLENKKNKQQIS